MSPDLPTALAEELRNAGVGAIWFADQRLRDEYCQRIAGDHDFDAIGRVWLARRLEAMKGNGFVKDAILFGGHYYTVQELLDLLAPEAP